MAKFHRTEFDLLPERAFRPRAGRRHGPMTLEGGGKGSDAPAPDPRLVEAQIRSMGIQDSAIQSILKNSNELLPLQKEQLQFGLDASRKAYEQSQSDRQWMLSRRDLLSGVQDKLVKDAADFNTEARREELAGQALADVNTAASSARDQSARALARMGVNPGSGRALALDQQTQIAQTAAGAGAANKARESARAEGYALTDRASNALAGYPAMSSAATGSGASFAAGGVGLVNSGLAGQNSGYGAAATGAGQMGANATSMWGAQANYKNAQDQINQGESFGSLAGGIGGLAAGLAKTGLFSDRRLKTDLKVVGRDAATGLRLWAFRYISDPARRYIGVMADEVKQVRPDAVWRGADGFDRVNYGLLGLEMVEA
jgi:hypothetical protein